MGFLGDLFKRGTDAIMDGVKDAVTDKVSDSVLGSVTNKGSNHEEERYSSDASNVPDDVEERIEYVLRSSFSQYEVRRNVDAREFMAEDMADSYSYVLYLEGTPKLSIMVMNGHNEYAKKSVRLAHAASENMSVPCINIMTYLPSTAEYIQTAIHEKLR